MNFVYPIKDKEKIQAIKEYLAKSPRDLLASQNIKNIAFSDLNQKYHNSGLGKSVELVEVLA